MRIRLFWAWLLLIMVSIQWVVGVVYVKLTDRIVVDVKMNEQEAAIAESVELEYGIHTKVRIVDQQTLDAYMSIGYGTPYLVTSEDSTTYFILDADSTKIQEVEHDLNELHEQQKKDKALLTINQLFSIFLFSDCPSGPLLLPTFSDTSNFAYQGLITLHDLPIPTPPPVLCDFLS